MKHNNILSTNNVKTLKGGKFGYITYIAYLSPFKDNSKGINICSHASEGCAKACLFSSGYGGMFDTVKNGRRARTEYFLSDRKGFLFQLKDEIDRALRLNEGKAIVTIRLNGTSDLPYEKFKVFEGNKNIFEMFSKVIFYDYTKNHTRFLKELPKNYHLTFSRSETNHEKAMELLSKGISVAMVFDKTPKKYEGYKVIDGDISDLRFKDGKGVIVGLKYKKMTEKGSDNSLAFKSGFAIKVKVEEIIKRYTKVISKIKGKKKVKKSLAV